MSHASSSTVTSNGLSPEQLRLHQEAALSFDWETGDLRHLGVTMSKFGLDLATAIRVFLNGTPDVFNHLHRDEVPLTMTARVAMLDCLHMKIGCGFYLPDPAVGLASVRSEAEAWFERQAQDRAQGITGRWTFDEARFRAISDDGPKQLIMAPTKTPKSAIWRTLFVPMWVRA